MKSRYFKSELFTSKILLFYNKVSENICLNAIFWLVFHILVELNFQDMYYELLNIKAVKKLINADVCMFTYYSRFELKATCKLRIKLFSVWSEKTLFFRFFM